ncbi:MAG TPA: M23 family metallopeptidase [Polyangiaceae bacterium]|jgi:murein DD-endopeptidase MepM/ murein hydrolase activator NlpD
MLASDRFPLRRSPVGAFPLPPVPARFGIRSAAQVARDFGEVARAGLTGQRFQVDVSSAGLLRPDLSLAAYAGLIPRDGRAPIFNLFDRSGGGRRYTQRVTRRTLRDFRGGRLSYDEHDGTDFVCPIGTPLVAAAPGTVVMIRDRWLRGGLTVAVDHGDGLVTQYTHCAEATAPLGTQVKRGDQVALSGAAGLDLVQFFPWVPPHVHFMVYVDGIPVDPFLAPGEAPRVGTWLDPNEPRTSGPRADDVDAPALSAVDEAALERIVATCTDARIREEFAACKNEKAWMAALAEDALAHDGWAWPAGRAVTVRPNAGGASARHVGLTVPLPVSAYSGIRFADAPWTAPRADD